MDVSSNETTFSFADFLTWGGSVSYDSMLDVKERIRDAVDIVDLVGRYIELRRSGRGMVGRCPWHDDSRPSLQVNPERQSYKCWVCDIGGDVFSFVMKMEGVDFKEALSMLADQAGIELPKTSGRGTFGSGGAAFDMAAHLAKEKGGKPQDFKKQMYNAMAWAETKYHECLLNDADAEPARRYLAERSIPDEYVRRFKVGFSPVRGDWLIRQLGGDRTRVQVLEAVGILARSETGGNPYDRFHGRLLFPIRDTMERPVGIGGRLLPDTGLKSKAKYVNSPETPLFSKSKLLYGLDKAREPIRKQHCVLIMEGYTDVIMAHRYGFTNAVAVLGTALGEQHIRMFRNFGARVILVLDGDEAGKKRAAELLGLFLSKSVDLRTLTLPAGSDPCDFLLENGEDAFQKMLDEQSIDVLEHVYRVHTQGIDLVNDLHGASEALERVLNDLARAPRLTGDMGGEYQLREQMLLERLASRFRLPETDIRTRLTVLRRVQGREASRNASRREQRKTGFNPTQAPGGAPPSSGKKSLSPDAVYEAGFSDEDADMPHDLFEQGSAVANAAQDASRPIDVYESELLKLLIGRPEVLPELAKQLSLEAIEHPTVRWAYGTYLQRQAAGEPISFDRLLLETEDPQVKNVLVGLDEEVTSGLDKMPVAPMEWVEQVVQGFQQRDIQRRRDNDVGSLRHGEMPDQERTNLLQDLIQQQRNRYGVDDPMDGEGRSDED